MSIISLSTDDVTPITRRVVMFDLDGTLITTKSGNIFPKNGNDWKWISPSVTAKLMQLAADGVTIVVVSNQKVSGNNEKKRNLIERKLKNIFNEMRKIVPHADVCFFAALGDDSYRKPSTRIFEDFIAHRLDCPNGTILAYVGDAAGREGDHSDSDRKFAYNVHLFCRWAKIDVKVRFYTPEEYFDGDKLSSTAGMSWTGFNPQKYLDEHPPEHAPPVPEAMRVSDTGVRVLAILVGAPASGKSTFARRLESEHNYARFALDEMPRKKNYDKAFSKFIEEHNEQSVVVDATNPNAEARYRWIKFADDFDEVAVAVFGEPHQLDKVRERVHHMNVYRSRVSREPLIPEIAYRTFYKKYTHPTELGIPLTVMLEPCITFSNRKNLMYFLQRS